MALIKLNYGPYEANGIIRHRPQRLHGLLSSLTAKGYGVEIVPSQHLNRLTVDIYGVMVFRCDIRNLLFNVNAEDDVVCQRALDVIEEATKRFFDETNIPKFVSCKRGMRFIEKKKLYHTSDYLTASNVELIYEVQDKFKDPDQEKPAAKSKESAVKFDKRGQVTDQVSGVSTIDNRANPSRSSTYDRTIDSSMVSSTITNPEPAEIKESAAVPETKREIKVEEVKEEDLKADEIKEDEIKKDEIKEDEIKKDEIKEEEIKKDETKGDEIKEGETKVDEIKKDEIKEDEIKEDEVKGEEIKKDETKGDEIKEGEIKVDEIKEDGLKEDEIKEGEKAEEAGPEPHEVPSLPFNVGESVEGEGNE